MEPEQNTNEENSESDLSEVNALEIAMGKIDEDAKKLAELVKEWWEEHKYDTISDCEGDEYNVFSRAPRFVEKAMDIIGDWERE